MFFFLIGIVSVPFSLYVFREYQDVRDWMMKDFKEPSYGWPRYSDFYITAIGCVISWIIMAAMNKVTWPIFYKYCKEKDNEKIRISKT